MYLRSEEECGGRSGKECCLGEMAEAWSVCLVIKPRDVLMVSKKGSSASGAGFRRTCHLQLGMGCTAVEEALGTEPGKKPIAVTMRG